MQRFSEYASVNLTDHIVMYHDHITDFVIWQIDSDQKKLFFHSVFKSCTDRNIDEFLRLIDIYGKYNGSIGKIAEALHVHKNTVQYRINKLADQTGYDIRNFEEYFYLKMAAKLYPKG